MTRLILLGVFLFVTLIDSHAQRLQFGLSGSINSTFFHKGESSYNDNFYTSKSRFGIGLSVPAHVEFNEHLLFKTGIGFQNKRYYFEQRKFDFPDVVDNKGTFYLTMKFTAVEVPLVITFSPGEKSNKYRIAYQLGCILSYNTPKAVSVGFNTLQYSGNDTLNYIFGGELNWEKYFSTDIYFGISIVKSKENIRRQELTFSYQYSFTASTRVEVLTNLSTTAMERDYKASLTPNLSYFALSYTFYPKWLNIIKKD